MLSWLYRMTNSKRIERINDHAFDLMCMGQDNPDHIQEALDDAKDALYNLTRVINDENDKTD